MVPQGTSLWNKSWGVCIISKWISTISSNFTPLNFIEKILGHMDNPSENTFNFSIMTSKMPTRWKHAFLAPISRNSPLDDPKHIRPINITSVFARTLEKLIEKHIVTHCEDQKLISDSQFGSLQERSVEAWKLTSFNDWTKPMMAKSGIDVLWIFQRLSAPVPNLLVKMNTVRIHSMIIECTRDFSTGRTYKVKVEGLLHTFRTECLLHKKGCPHLYPFLLYTYELPDIIAAWSWRTKCTLIM